MALPLSVVALALAPTCALAHSGVSVRSGEIEYAAPDAGGISTLVISMPNPSTINLKDPTLFGGMTPGPCVPITDHEVDCPSAGITLVTATLGAENDVATVEGTLTTKLIGGTGDDTLNGGDGSDNIFGTAGQDTLHGGAGNDRLEGGIDPDVLDGGPGDDNLVAADGSIDQITCGPGNDHVQADPGDVIIDPEACEQVEYALPSTAGGDQTPGNPADATAPSITNIKLRPSAFVPTRRGLTVSSAGGAYVTFMCSERASVAMAIERKSGPDWRRVKTRRFGWKARAGRNAFRLTGRARGRALKPARYRLVMTPTDLIGNIGVSQQAGFRVLNR